MKLIFTGLAAAALLSAPVAAQSVFEGPYVGAQVGYHNYYDADPTLDGFEIGVLAGLSGVNGRIYGAVEGEFSLSTAEVSFTDALLGPSSLSATYSIGGSLIVGYTVTDRSLVYSKVGLIYTEFEAEALGLTDTDTAGGVSIGAGSEVAVGSGFSLRGEVDYRFLDLDGADVDSFGLELAVIRRF